MNEDASLVERLETGIAATVREIDELRAENTRLRAQLAQPKTTTLHTTDTLKSVREALCVAQSAIPRTHAHQPDYWPRFNETIQRLLDDIERQRPLGSDGKHGSLHTPTCQCQDVA